MKANVLSLCFATALFAVTVNAQSLQNAVVADVPFDFAAGSTQMAAGEYRVESTSMNVLVMINSETHKSAMLLFNAAVRPASDEAAKLVFKRYGDKYVLAQVWDAHNARGAEVVTHARPAALLTKGGRPGTVIIAARRP